MTPIFLLRIGWSENIFLPTRQYAMIENQLLSLTYPPTINSIL